MSSQLLNTVASDRRQRARHRKLSPSARGHQHLAYPALLQATAAHTRFSDGVAAEFAEAAVAALIEGRATKPARERWQKAAWRREAAAGTSLRSRPQVRDRYLVR
jgi:hypothetical protein